MKTRLLMTAAAILFAGSAVAADLPRPPVYKAAPAALDLWTGWIVGANVGYDWGSASAIGVSQNTNGFMGGASFGYRQKIGSWVLGLEGDAGFGSADGTHVFNKFVSANFKTDFVGSARVVAGYLVMPDLLVYGTGGAAFSNSRLKVTAGKTTLSDSEHPFGWTIGAGAEYQLASVGWQNWSTKIEYRHDDFGSSAFGAPVGGGGALIGVKVKDVDNRLMWGLNYRFM